MEESVTMWMGSTGEGSALSAKRQYQDHYASTY